MKLLLAMLFCVNVGMGQVLHTFSIPDDSIQVKNIWGRWNSEIEYRHPITVEDWRAYRDSCKSVTITRYLYFEKSSKQYILRDCREDIVDQVFWGWKYMGEVKKDTVQTPTFEGFMEFMERKNR